MSKIHETIRCAVMCSTGIHSKDAVSAGVTKLLELCNAAQPAYIAEVCM